VCVDGGNNTMSLHINGTKVFTKEGIPSTVHAIPICLDMDINLQVQGGQNWCTPRPSLSSYAGDGRN
jgi:hypothetical protein